MQYDWINTFAKMSPDNTIIEFHSNFNQEIEPRILPDQLTNLIFGVKFNQKIKPGTLPVQLTNLAFGT